MALEQKEISILIQIESDIKRLDPNFSISQKSSESIFSVLEAVQNIVTLVIKEKTKLENNSTFSTQKSINSNDSNQLDKIMKARGKLKNAQVHLFEYEKLLVEKEKILENKNFEFEGKLKKMQENWGKIEAENQKLQEATKECEREMRRLSEKEKNLEISYRKFLTEKTEFEIEKNDFGRRTGSNEIRNKEVGTSKGADSVKNINGVCALFTEKMSDLDIREERLRKFEENLKSDRKDLQVEAKQLADERERISILKQEVQQEKHSLSTFSQDTGKKINQTSQLRKESPFNIEALLSPLNISKFNKESQIKNSIRDQKTLVNPKELQKLFASLKLIKTSFQSTKQEIISFCSEIFEEFRSLSHKTNTNLISPEKPKHLKMRHNRTFSFMDADSPGIKHFEEEFPQSPSDKMQEALLNFANASKAQELAEISKSAKILERKRLEIIQERTEIELEKAKIKNQKHRLGLGIKQLASKQSDLLNYKKELDTMAAMLRSKEVHLDNKH